MIKALTSLCREIALRFGESEARRSATVDSLDKSYLSSFKNLSRHKLLRADIFSLVAVATVEVSASSESLRRQSDLNPHETGQITGCRDEGGEVFTPSALRRGRLELRSGRQIDSSGLKDALGVTLVSAAVAKDEKQADDDREQRNNRVAQPKREVVEARGGR